MKGRFLQAGFTLAELLIALGILGVICAFTIPKILSSSTTERYNSVTKEAAAAVSEAYTAYKMHNTPSSSTTMQDLIPYLNYVKEDTSTTIDNHSAGATASCSNSWKCYQLHSGAMLMTFGTSFGGTTNSHALNFHIDPDGVQSDTRITGFWLYYDGRLVSEADIKPGTLDSDGGPYGAGSDAPWFSWN